MAGSDSNNAGKVICGRLYLLMIATAAIAASVLMVFSCQFFAYESTDGLPMDGLSAPFDKLSVASVGLFSHSELTTNTEDIPLFGDECVEYPSWQDASNKIYFQVAQWCGMVAPGVAFLAWIQIFFDMICCRLCGGFIIISLLFFSAAVLQGCTFLVFVESEFCYQGDSKCEFMIGAWYSIGAAAAYLVLAILSPTMPLSQYEERKGCCIVKGTPPPSSPKSDEETGDGDGDWEVVEEQSNSDKSVATNENGEPVEDEAAKQEDVEKKEEEEAPDTVCGINFDNLCGGPNVEEGTEVQLEDSMPAENVPAENAPAVENDGNKETAAL